MAKSIWTALLVGLTANVLAIRAEAAIELITNGNFETGTFAGWTHLNLAGGTGDWFIDAPGSTTPISGIATIGSAANGSFYAVTDQSGPGTHVLLQTFIVPVGVTSLTLSFDMFVNDSDGGPIVNPAGLDHTAIPNQHGRVDILTAGAGAFSTAVADVVSNHYLSVDAGADPHAFTSYSFNITGLAAGTYQLRFGEVDNQLFLNMGVDNVSILAESVPEPGSLAIVTFGVMGLGAIGYRRHKRVR